VPDHTSNRRVAHYLPPVTAIGNISGCKLPRGLSGTFNRGLHFKTGVVLEEADEPHFWIELLVEAGIVPRERVEHGLQEANELVSIFVASLRTVKGLRTVQGKSAI
jgi:hypothetical protein